VIFIMCWAPGMTEISRRKTATTAPKSESSGYYPSWVGKLAGILNACWRLITYDLSIRQKRPPSARSSGCEYHTRWTGFQLLIPACFRATYDREARRPKVNIGGINNWTIGSPQYWWSQCA
jgi:hypothetical protein